ncbi:MAG TPA: CpsD/CapB family tyrosine-protein kinase [Phycisphaerae bacterium]|nr:CpsD/CapB family tyrosine-protein kinase [Phycisphaerae bacterium]
MLELVHYSEPELPGHCDDDHVESELVAGRVPTRDQVWPPPTESSGNEKSVREAARTTLEQELKDWQGEAEEIDGVIEEIRRINNGAGAALIQTSCHVRAKSEAELGLLWTNIFLSVESGTPNGVGRAAPPTSVVVSAARRGDGGTQIAISLGLIGAEANPDLRIALVDFNLRRPAVAELLGIQEAPGVTDVLERRLALESAVQAVALPNGSMLHVLPAGTPSDQPLTLLKSRQAKKLMASLQEQFDHVVIDAPSASAYPDAPILGSMAGGILLVVRAGRTPRETVAAVKKRLDLRGVRCLGLALNQR